MLFCVLTRLCHFVQLSEILVDLLLVFVQVLRLSASFRQSGVASFVDFFSSLSLLVVMLSLFSVFWRPLLQHYVVVVYCSDVRLRHLQHHNSALRHFVIIGSRWVSGILSTVVCNNVVCEVWLHSVWSGRFVDSAVRRSQRDSLVRPTPQGGHRFSCFSLSSDLSD